MNGHRLWVFFMAVTLLASAVIVTGSVVRDAAACTVSQRWDFGEAVLGTPKTAMVNLVLYVPVGYPSGQIMLTGFWFKTGQSGPFRILTSIPQGGIPLSAEQSVNIEMAFTPSGLGPSEDVLTLTSNMPGVCGEIALSGTGVEDKITIDDVIRFFDSAVNCAELWGAGSHKPDQQESLVSAMDTQQPDKEAENRLSALRNMIEAAGTLIENADYDAACRQLEDVREKIDGLYPPYTAPDFAEGPAIPELTDKLLRLREQLGCGLAGS
jgi:hypothetical protein